MPLFLYLCVTLTYSTITADRRSLKVYKMVVQILNIPISITTSCKKRNEYKLRYQI